MDYSNRMHHDPAPHSSSLGMLPVHPDVKLKHLPFYDCVAELMKPTSLGNQACSFYGKNRKNAFSVIFDENSIMFFWNKSLNTSIKLASKIKYTYN